LWGNFNWPVVLNLGEFPSEIHLWVDRYDAEKDIPSAPAERSEVSVLGVILSLADDTGFIIAIAVATQTVFGEGAPAAGIL
jgi:hypothetical protein